MNDAQLGVTHTDAVQMLYGRIVNAILMRGACMGVSQNVHLMCACILLTDSESTEGHLHL